MVFFGMGDHRWPYPQGLPSADIKWGDHYGIVKQHWIILAVVFAVMYFLSRADQNAIVADRMNSSSIGTEQRNFHALN